MAGINKPTKPTNLVPRSFGGIKNNFEEGLIQTGYEPNVPQTYNGDNLNFQLDATGKELEYNTAITDYICGINATKTPIVDLDGKLNSTQIGIKVYDVNEKYALGEWVIGIIDDKTDVFVSQTSGNIGNPLTDPLYWIKKDFNTVGVPVGTIYQAIRTDIPANSLRLDGTEYTTGFNSFVTNYLTTGKIVVKSYEQWELERQTNGAVGFFGYDEATGAFKTPIIPEGTFLAQAVQSGNFGTFLNSSFKAHSHTRGTMEITGTFGAIGGDNATGAFYQAGTSGKLANSGAVDTLAGFQASRSWTGATSVEGGDDTYPKHLKYPFFVVVANTNAEEPSQVDWDNFVGNLDTKLNKDYSNSQYMPLFQNQLTNCILEAPNGSVEVSGGIITIKGGLKLLISDGLNEDKTLKNIEETIEEDVSLDVSSSYSATQLIALFWDANTNSIRSCGDLRYLVGLDADKPQTLSSANAHYYRAIDTNVFYRTSGSTTANWQLMPKLFYLGRLSFASGQYTIVDNPQPLHLLDYSNKQEIVSWTMPDYSAGITTGYNTTFTPRMDGYLFLSFRGNYAVIEVYLDSASGQLIAGTAADVNTINNRPFVCIPVSKGQTYYIGFGGTKSEIYLNTFYPCKGVN